MILEFKNEFSFLSNFYKCDVKIGDYIFPSSEHAYMSFKNDSIEWKNECQRTDLTPGQIKRKGSQIELVSNWEDIKIVSMGLVLFVKFSQNDDLAAKLRDTGSQNLVEGNMWGDKFLGVCLKSSPNIGENHLGRLLMQTRTYF